MVAARFRGYYDRQARERHEQLSGRPADGKPVENLPQDTGKARDAAGKEFGVGPPRVWGNPNTHCGAYLKRGRSPACVGESLPIGNSRPWENGAAGPSR